MASKRLTFALIQSNLYWEEKEKNLASFTDKINSIDFECDVVILPEMFSTGFTMNTTSLGEDMNGKTMLWLKNTSESSNKIITGSFIANINNQYFNRLIWMRPDGTFEYYDKKHLFRMANEDDYFSAGNSTFIVNLNGWKIRPLICYDLRFPVWSRNQYKIEQNMAIPDYDDLLYVANWPAVRINAWDILLKARAVENQAYCIGVNRIGEDGNGRNYNGHTTAIDPKGEFILNPVEETEGIFKIVLEHESLRKFREKFPQGLDADEFSLSD